MDCKNTENLTQKYFIVTVKKLTVLPDSLIDILFVISHFVRPVDAPLYFNFNKSDSKFVILIIA